MHMNKILCKLYVTFLFFKFNDWLQILIAGFVRISFGWNFHLLGSVKRPHERQVALLAVIGKAYFLREIVYFKDESLFNNKWHTFLFAQLFVSRGK